jgi:hypothetical protein
MVRNGGCGGRVHSLFATSTAVGGGSSCFVDSSKFEDLSNVDVEIAQAVARIHAVQEAKGNTCIALHARATCVSVSLVCFVTLGTRLLER